MRRELVDDFPEESDKKLQEEYERERRCFYYFNYNFLE
jgi:hypothetical protein